MVSDSFQGGCVCENAAGCGIGTDNVEFAALTAPAPLKLVGATGDWTAKTMTNAFPAIAGVYELMGADRPRQRRRLRLPAQLQPDHANAVYAFMGRWLLGIEDPRAPRKANRRPRSPRTPWYVTPSTPHREPEVARELEADLIKTLGSSIGDLAPSAAGPRDGRRRPAIPVDELEGPDRPGEPAARRSLVARRGPSRSHARTSRSSIPSWAGRSPGEAIPVLRLIPRIRRAAHGDRQPSRQVGAGQRRGRAGRAGRSAPGPGHEVVGYDPLFVGESLDPLDPVSHRPETAHFEPTTPSRPPTRCKTSPPCWRGAAAADGRAARSTWSQGTSGYQALVVRPVLEGLSRTVIASAPAEAEELDEWPATIDLPGVEQFGGVRGRRGSSRHRHRSGSTGTSAHSTRRGPGSAYELAGVPSMLRTYDDQPGIEAICGAGSIRANRPASPGHIVAPPVPAP